jgi:hypothetical protein
MPPRFVTYGSYVLRIIRTVLTVGRSLLVYLINRHPQSLSACRKRADSVAKVESCIGPNFWRNLIKREAIDDSYNLSRVTEVAYKFSVRR